MPIADYHEKFAAVYDRLYQDRDIAGEVRQAIDLLELNAAHSMPPHVLDFGCGTGGHVLTFAAQGISATGFDASPAMIAQARAKTPAPGAAEVHFAAGALADFMGSLNGRMFDGAVSFFNVLNCISTPSEMLAHLRLLHGRLARGAKFLAEVWNGAAVFADQPRPDIRHCLPSAQPNQEIIRITVPHLDRINQLCTLRYRVLILDRANSSYGEFESCHQLRFLTPVQYRHLFEQAQLTMLDEFPKGHPGEAISENDWYISYLVRREC